MPITLSSASAPAVAAAPAAAVAPAAAPVAALAPAVSAPAEGPIVRNGSGSSALSLASTYSASHAALPDLASVDTKKGDVSDQATTSDITDDQLANLKKYLEESGLVESYEAFIGSALQRGGSGTKHKLMKLFELISVKILLWDIQNLQRGSRFKVPPYLEHNVTKLRAITANAEVRAISLAMYSIFQLIQLAKNDEVDAKQREIINPKTVQSNPLLLKFFQDMKLVLDAFSIDRLRMFAGNDQNMLDIIDELEPDFNFGKDYYQRMFEVELKPSPAKEALMSIQTTFLEKYLALNEKLNSYKGSLDLDAFTTLNAELLSNMAALISTLERNEHLKSLRWFLNDDASIHQSKLVFTAHPDGILKSLEDPMPLDPIYGSPQSITFLDELRNGVYALKTLLKSGEKCVLWHGSDLDRTNRDAVAAVVVRLHLALEFSKNDETLLSKLQDLVAPLKQIITILTDKYQKGISQLAQVAAVSSESIKGGYQQHVRNLGELVQCLDHISTEQTASLGSFCAKDHSQTSLGQVGGVINQGLKEVSGDQADYNVMLENWINDFEAVIKEDSAVKNQLNNIQSQGRVPARQLEGVMKHAFPDIFGTEGTQNRLQEFYRELDNPDFKTTMRTQLNEYLNNPKTLEDTHMIDALKVFNLLNQKGYFEDLILADFESEEQCMVALILNKILDVEGMRIRLLFENFHDVKNAQNILGNLRDRLGFADFSELSKDISVMFANSDTSLRAGNIGLLHTSIVAVQLKRLGFNVEVGRGSAPERGDGVPDISSQPDSIPDLITLQPGKAARLVLNQLSEEDPMQFQIKMLRKVKDEIMETPSSELEGNPKEKFPDIIRRNLLRLLNSVITLDCDGPRVG